MLRAWAVSFHLPLNNKAIEETTMRKLTRNLVLAGIAGATTLCSVQALAADEPKPVAPSPHRRSCTAATPPPPEHVFTTNAAFVSNYIFRGLTQTFGKPAVQQDSTAHSSGAYAGVWGSNISSQQYAGEAPRSIITSATTANLPATGVGPWVTTATTIRARTTRTPYPPVSTRNITPRKSTPA